MPRIPFLSITNRLVVAFLLSCLLAVCGCQKQVELPPTHPASGKVVYKDGTPMKGGTIQFLSTTPDSSIVVSGAIGDDGSFTLYTLKDKRKAAGAVEGKYKVTILPPQDAEHHRIMPIPLPDTYTVKPGENTFPTMKVPRASR